MKISEIMSSDPVTVEMDDRLATVKEIFDNVKFHHLLVVDDGVLYGILSDRDLRKAISPNIDTNIETFRDLQTLNRRVHQIMTRHPRVLTPEGDLQDAINMFNSCNISCIPIVDSMNRPVGVVSWRDILGNLDKIKNEWLSQR